MRPQLRWRLAAIVAGLAMVFVLTLWGLNDSWRRFSVLERKLTGTQFEAFKLAGQFQQRLLRLNYSIIHFAENRDAAAWQGFEQESRRLDAWIDEQSPKLHSPREHQLFDQLNAAYDQYLSAARAIRDAPPPVAAVPHLAEMDRFEMQAQRLLTLGTQLADAHRQAEESFLNEANRSLHNLRTLLFAAVAMLLVLVGVLGWIVYRDWIAPLRTRLGQSVALLERQEKLATLGTLAAGIAHEIRNPLTSIKARLYTLSKHIRDRPDGLADTNVIGDEISRLERIVQDVLTFARPSEPRLAEVMANEPLATVHSLMGAALEKSGVQLILESGEEFELSMDVPLIKQVLINLVRNAAEAAGPDGKVTLRTRQGRTALNGKVCDVGILEVEDTGPGIPPEVEKRLFDPFFTTKEAGTGLGLSMAARIVEKHGGTLQYRTQLGRGTTFGIVLPLINRAVAPTEATTDPSTQSCLRTQKSF